MKRTVEKRTKEQEKQRDDLAKHAMVAIIAKHPPVLPYTYEECNGEYSIYNCVARGAYKYADAMLRVKEEIGEHSMSTPEEREAKTNLGFHLIEARREEEEKRKRNAQPAPYKNKTLSKSKEKEPK